MAQPYKSLNSKVFLVIYLVVIAVMLLVWVSRMEFQKPEHRDIPSSLSPYLLSPPQPLPQLLLHQLANGKVFTNASLEDKWSFVYFTHGYCSPACDTPLSTIRDMEQHFSAQSVQFILINYDLNPSSSSVWAQLSNTVSFASIPILQTEPAMLDVVISAFNFLYLKTSVDDGYVLEQDHLIYLVDPKGRIYATFQPPYDVATLSSRFAAIRTFYARTE